MTKSYGSDVLKGFRVMCLSMFGIEKMHFIKDVLNDLEKTDLFVSMRSYNYKVGMIPPKWLFLVVKRIDNK